MKAFLFLSVLLSGAALLTAQTPIEIHIEADKPGPKVAPALYGLMTEEINYSYDGGLYAELIRNRSMKEDAKDPVHWSALRAATVELDPSTPLNDAIATSLKVTVNQPGGGVSNDGFWGIPVHPGTHYHASFYAKAVKDFTGSLTVAIVSSDGSTIEAVAQIPHLAETWQKYDVILTTGPRVTASAANKFAITASHPGTIWLSMVSLFPPTYKNRINGNRPDIMQLLADMHPAFLRFPGGNYLEGNTLETRFEWKKTIGPIDERPGHMDDAWKYWSSDGMGLLEFLNWCEDLHIQPLLAVYAGYSMRQIRVAPGPDLDPYVKEALDEIEYVTGAATTTWGARRAADGHPEPFHLEYVEVGNEDNFDRQAGSYDGRFTQFFDAIKAKYPRLQVIATAKVTTRQPDLIDEHYYRNSEDEMASHAHDYDSRPRTGPKVFVGEWATRVGEPTPNMSAALGDAAWMTGMERNSDLVLMSCYAPLFVNVSPGAMQWKTDLIGYDAMNSYGSPAYYAQQMFSAHHGDTVLPIIATDIPEKTWQPAPRRGRADSPPPPTPAPQQVPLLFFNATRDGKTGMIYLKVVNRAGSPQPVKVSLEGMKTVESRGQAITLSASGPEDTNSIANPKKIVPVTTVADKLGASFTRAFPAYSITVLEFKAK